MMTVKKSDIIEHLTNQRSVEHVNRVHSVPAKQRNRERYLLGVKYTLAENKGK